MLIVKSTKKRKSTKAQKKAEKKYHQKKSLDPEYRDTKILNSRVSKIWKAFIKFRTELGYKDSVSDSKKREYYQQIKNFLSGCDITLSTYREFWQYLEIEKGSKGQKWWIKDITSSTLFDMFQRGKSLSVSKEKVLVSFEEVEEEIAKIGKR